MGKQENRAFDYSRWPNWIDPKEAIPYDKNAKIHDEDQVRNIANSIRRFGWQQDTVLTRDNVLVIGHGRRLAALELGCMLPYHIVDKDADELTEEDIRELRFADNLTNESPWDYALGALDMEGLSFDGFDFDLSNFFAENEEVVEDDYEPEIPKEPKSKRGDIYQLGEHRLMCGDATSTEDVQLLMGGEQADISFTSPPYGAARSAKIRDHYERGKKTAESFYNSHDDVIEDWLDLIAGAFAQMKLHSKSQWVNIQMLADNKRDLIRWMDDNRDELSDIIVWDKMKAPPQMARNILNNRYEFIFVFGDGTRTIPYGNFHGNEQNIIQIPTGNNEYSDIHRAVFPVSLPAEIMRIASKAMTVLDLFGGTGSTMIAAEQTGRKCYMMELDPKYVDVIVSRWEAFTGEKAVLLNGEARV